MEQQCATTTTTTSGNEPSQRRSSRSTGRSGRRVPNALPLLPFPSGKQAVSARLLVAVRTNGARRKGGAQTSLKNGRVPGYGNERKHGTVQERPFDRLRDDNERKVGIEIKGKGEERPAPGFPRAAALRVPSISGHPALPKKREGRVREETGPHSPQLLNETGHQNAYRHRVP